MFGISWLAHADKHLIQVHMGVRHYCMTVNMHRVNILKKTNLQRKQFVLPKLRNNLKIETMSMLKKNENTDRPLILSDNGQCLIY